MNEIPITKEEEEIANKEAAYIFGYLRKKYCNESVKDLDIILNSLCFAILRLMHTYVPKEDRAFFVESIITKVLNKNSG